MDVKNHWRNKSEISLPFAEDITSCVKNDWHFSSNAISKCTKYFKNILKAASFNKQFLHPIFINMFLKGEQIINSMSQILKQA